MKQQNEFAAIISDKRRLRAATADFPIAKLEQIRTKIDQIIAQRKNDEEQALKFQREARDTAQRSIKDLQEKLGISREEAIDLILANGTLKPNKGSEPKAKVPPKYEITDGDGKTLQWSGRGRMPVVFKHAIESGKSLNDLLIKPKGD